MTGDLRARSVRLVLLDIEGTTTPIAFVHDVLFPFARARLGAWLHAHGGTPHGRDVVAGLRAESQVDQAHGAAVPPWIDGPGPETAASAVAYAEWLMDRDRKSPALKTWQGLIWEEGYAAGVLRGEVYPDVARALRRWRSMNVGIAIYSSGSVLAQRRLFASTSDGDLTSLIEGFFDTGVGAKVDPPSYSRIAATLSLDTLAILFVSDVTRELEAAAAAGCQVVLSVRPGNPPQPGASAFQAVTTFDALG